MNVYGELTSAQAENLGSDPTLSAQRPGRLWYRTDLSQFKADLGGSADTLAMLAATQTLSNKSHSDPITMAQVATPSAPSASNTKIYAKSDGTFYQLPNGGSESQVGSIINAGTQFKQIVTPANPPANYMDFYPKSDGNFYSLNSSGVESLIGSGGSGTGKNYLSAYNGNTGNGNFELNATTGWSLFNTTLTSGIPTGAVTGGAASVTTFNTVSSNQLAGKYSLQTASSGAWSAGQGFISSAFTIDSEDQAKVLTFTGYYKVVANPSNGNFSGTSSNTFAIYIYDVTNSAWIQPAGVYNIVQSSGVGRFTATFQTTSNSTQYQVAVLAVNASAGAITMYWDDIACSPQTAPFGPAMTDPLSFTPTVSAGFGTTSNANCFYRRDGNMLEMWGTFTSGTVAASVAQIGLPSGLSVDTTKIDRTSGQLVGSITSTAITGTAGVPNDASLFIKTTDTTVLSVCNVAAGASSNNLVALNVTAFNNSNVPISFWAKVPISGWSSNVQMSNDTDTRVVAASLYLAGTQSGVNPNNSTAAINLDTALYDTHSGFSSGNHNYVVPVSGYYKLSAEIYLGSTNVVNNLYCVSFQVNGSEVARGPSINVPATATFITAGFTEQKLNAGDTVSLSLFGGGNNSVSTLTVGNSSKNTTFLTISRMSGPAVAAATETVSAKYYASGNTTSTTSTPINYDTKVFDTHGAVTTGASWHYTAPISGRYLLTTYNNAAAGTNSTFLAVYKNGSAYETLAYTSNIDLDSVPGFTQIQLNAGDTIDLRCTTSSVIAGNATQNSGAASHIEITRIGN